MNAPHPFALQDSEVWASHIAGQANLPDERLNTRLATILTTFANRPLDAIPQAAGSAGQAKAIYRFLDNQRMGLEDFLQPLVDTTVDACRGVPTLLAIQDTSAASYPTLAATTGLGKLNDGDVLGLFFHTTLAVDLDGVPRGLLHQSFWRRPVDHKAGNHKQRPIQDKESYKWLEGIEAAEEAIDQLPADQRPRLLHVFDREGDIHEVLQRITDSPHGAVIRAAQNRSVAGPITQAFAAIAATPAVAVQRLTLADGTAAPKRTVEMAFRAVTLTLTPGTQHRQRRSVTWTLVEARQTDAADGVEPLHWLLWTTEPAQTLEQILHVLELYKRRWLIEDFHLTLKSGCRIEKLSLEAYLRLCKAIILYSAVALRIVALRNLARTHPEAPCTRLLTQIQWQALYAHFHQRRPTADTPIPTIREAVRWIGRLGGHLNRKRDGLPGVRTLWRGWRDLDLLVAGYLAAQH
ncbi:MAG: IS4 family transposase [Mycobacteriales bacterium]